MHDDDFGQNWSYADHARAAAAENGYCCAGAWAGGDCGCHGDPDGDPTDEEMIADGYYQRESDGMWVLPGWAEREAEREAEEAAKKAAEDAKWGEGEIRF